MEMNRTRRSAINIVLAVFLKITQIVLPFLTRTIIIYQFGIEWVGLSGLFTSIIGVLNLAEMGVGAALVYAMYKPIQEHNTEKVSALLNLYRKYYIIIGIAVLLIGLLITPFTTKLIKDGTYPLGINIYFIYIIYLVDTAITYLVYAYKSSLLDAHQMGYLASKVKIEMLILRYAMQITALLFIKNYYIYMIIMPICTLITCLWTGKISDKHYSDIRPCGELEKSEQRIIIEKIKSLFLYKIGSIVLNSVDNIVISWYFGATILGIYNNYYYIVTSLFSVLLAVSLAITPSIGSCIVSNSKENNYKDFMMFSMGYNYGIGWCTIYIICLMQPFINLWAGSENLLPVGCVFLFGLYFFCFRVGDVVGWYKDAAGLWEPDKYRPLISSIVNLTLNLILIRFIGLYGILVSTIVALVTISYPIAVRILHKYLDMSLKKYVNQQAYCIVCILVVLALTYFLCASVVVNNLWLMLIYKGLICMFFPSGLLFILFSANGNFRRFIFFIRQKFFRRKKNA